MFSTFERIYSFSITTIVFLVAVVVTGFFWFVATYFFNDFALYIPIAIIGCVIGVIIGAYLFIILSLPFQMSKKFDVIKDKVALRAYNTVNDFQNDIAEFIITTFDYPGVSIDGGVFNFNQADLLTVNVDFDLDLLEDLNEEKSVKKINGYKAFYIPIQIGNQNLGSMRLISKGYAIPSLKSILCDFENLMLDDQLLHVQNFTK